MNARERSFFCSRHRTQRPLQPCLKTAILVQQFLAFFMHLSWLGQSSVKLQTKPFDEDIHVVIDPYRPKAGVFPRSLSPHIGLFTHGDKDAITLSGEPFTLSSPGECEIKGVLIVGVQGHTEDEVFYRIDSEGLTVGHLGKASKQLTDEQLETLSGVDILFVPVGGDGCFDAEEAVKAVNAIEPRVVIPIAYKSDTDPGAAPIDKFLKEIGHAGEKAEKKLILKKKDLPTDDMRVIVIEKE